MPSQIKLTILNLTNAPVTIGGETIGACGWQPLPAARKTVMLIVDIFQASQCWDDRGDLAVVHEILADGSDRTAVALAHGGFVIVGPCRAARPGLPAFSLTITPETQLQLEQLQDNEPNSL